MHETKRSHHGAGSTLKRIIVLTSLIVGLAGVSSMFAAAAKADTVGPITFEPAQGYATGNINGQQGWMKTGLYDVAVASVSSFTAASGYGFGTQSLRLSDAFTTGAFGDQTFSPGLLSPAGESTATSHFDASFMIGTTLATEQTGLHMSVSPDDGNGSRMSYLRFEDQTDGVHVFFDDVHQSAPCTPASCANFVETYIGTLSRTRAHTIRFLINLKSGPGNDDVKIFIDGKKKISGTTWENYYRYDPEAAGNAFQVPPVTKMLFRESGDTNTFDINKGFLVDGLSLSSTSPPMSKDECKNGGWASFTDPSFKNQGDCISYVNNGK